MEHQVLDFTYFSLCQRTRKQQMYRRHKVKEKCLLKKHKTTQNNRLSFSIYYRFRMIGESFRSVIEDENDSEGRMLRGKGHS